MSTAKPERSLPLLERVWRYRFPVTRGVIAEVAFLGAPLTADALAITIETLQVMERACRSDEEARAPKATTDGYPPA
jgi:hypothetical protein